MKPHTDTKTRKVSPQSYQRTGALAVHPQAFVELFMVPASRENEERGNAVIVDICGPLTQHDEGIFDSYEAIRGRVQAACESAAAAIVLRVDSPGGDVAGCFDTARAIRAMCAAASKPLYAHVEGKACSAGYALAAAANTVCLGDTGVVGSIGVISAREDLTAMNTARGLRVALVASGARKADGSPDAPITEAELTATQELVDSMAAVFFDLVAELRGTSAAAIAALQAALFHKDAAVKARLADAVLSFDEMLAAIASGRNVVPSPYHKARTALEQAAEGDDAKAAAAAKRALAAMRAASNVSLSPRRVAARPTARAISRPTTLKQPARPARKATMSSGQSFTKLNRLARELEDALRAEGVTVPQFAPAPDASAAPAADTERAEYLPAMDRAMRFAPLRPQARLEGSTLSCGLFPDCTTTERTVAPQQRVSRPAAQRTSAASAEPPEYLAAMDAAMGTGNEPGVRMESPTRQVFRP